MFICTAQKPGPAGPRRQIIFAAAPTSEQSDFQDQHGLIITDNTRISGRLTGAKILPCPGIFFISPEQSEGLYISMQSDTKNVWMSARSIIESMLIGSSHCTTHNRAGTRSLWTYSGSGFLFI